MTTRQQIARYLNLHPGKTAWQIAQGIKRSAGLVSGILTKDRKARRVSVTRTKGPRGGRAYGRYAKA